MEKLLKISQLKVHFPVKGGIWMRPVATCKAVDGVSLEISKGETLGLVGESGCGKSTLARTVVGLNEPTTGEILLDGQKLGDYSGNLGKKNRKRVQMVFQDPAESLNSRHTVGQILEEPLVVHKKGDQGERASRVKELLNLVGLPLASVARYPFEFSGGQRQRIGIARALVLNPEILVLDEPVSALDLSIRSQVINLLLKLKNRLGLTCLFISHDLSVVRHLSDRIAVMYLGKVVEIASAEELINNPLHAYTRSLIGAIPQANPKVHGKFSVLSGEVPSPINPPPGCPFGYRVGSPFYTESIGQSLDLKEFKPGHFVQDCPCCVI
jgi:oligopeptide/dipeptide ABC transporter ATP-binding protein